MAQNKLQIALYWAAACGGCDVAVLDTNEFVLEVASIADIRLWPIAVDAKYKAVEAMKDEELDLTLISGAIRNSENEHVAKLLRRKSKALIALGSCAYMGGIPGLANIARKDEIFTRVYLNNPSIEAGNQRVPHPEFQANGFRLRVPQFYKRVYRLNDIVDVDYFVPGCPPAPEQVKAVLSAAARGDLPAKGSVIGASERALCDDCKRAKTEKKVKGFHRPFEIIQDPEKCLLEQGIICMGSATRSGCGVRCPNSGVGCRGCYGPTANVTDQGIKFLCAVSSIIDSKDPKEIQEIIDALPDFLSFAYRFSLPASLLQRSFRT